MSKTCSILQTSTVGETKVVSLCFIYRTILYENSQCRKIFDSFLNKKIKNLVLNHNLILFLSKTTEDEPNRRLLRNVSWSHWPLLTKV
ncbi:hypothetical protein BpHYR1_015584 [Brachionus plicatilis]|uniref:Uncharacterized protein n=1 Tax=Brachionus plicatilis TaxID=10195 RepID=A0A3M7PZ83_BRAPC|nr:hypothetical protein BpHYR1_015584 [Brachionus plicatilis]